MLLTSSAFCTGPATDTNLLFLTSSWCSALSARLSYLQLTLVQECHYGPNNKLLKRSLPCRGTAARRPRGPGPDTKRSCWCPRCLSPAAGEEGPQRPWLCCKQTGSHHQSWVQKLPTHLGISDPSWKCIVNKLYLIVHNTEF